MEVLHPQYYYDESGKKSNVILPYKEFEYLLELAEEMEEVKIYDRAKSKKQEFIDLDDAIREIENNV